MDAFDFTTVAFRASTSVIRALIPKGVVGTYVLFRENTAIYVGRSDNCLQTRLARHEHLNEATHLTWLPRASPVAAFYLEAAWYHSLDFSQRKLNKIHPARPNGYLHIRCPFCGRADELALAFSA
jgi:hypothetical protein